MADAPAQITADDIAAIVKAQVTEHLNAAITGHTKRQEAAFQKQIDALVEKLKPSDAAPVVPPVAEGAEPAKRVLTREVADEVAAIKKELAAERSKREAAETSARMTSLRTAAQSEMAKVLGEGNAMLAPLMAQHFDVGKRFDFDDAGQPSMVFQRDGYVEKVPLSQGIAELAKTELKPFIQSAASRLPPAGVRANGQPFAPTNGAARSNPFAEMAAEGLAASRPDLVSQGLAGLPGAASGAGNK